MKFQWPIKFGKEKEKQLSVQDWVKAQRAYDAAQIGRLVSDWIASSSSADSESLGSLKTIRARSRELGRNNDYMRNFLREFQDNVIGEDGFQFQSQIMKKGTNDLDDVLNKQIEKEFFRWMNASSCHTAGKLHFVDIERLIAREVPEAGEFFVRFIYKKFGESKIPFALELIEPDLIDEDFNDSLSNGRKIIAGVEVNEWKRPIAYHIRKKHQGDNSLYSAENNERVRIPAEDIIHLHKVERWPQTRGIPLVVSSIIRLRNMGKMEEAELIRARAAASIMGFIYSPEGELRDDGKVGKDRVTDFEPGTYKYLGDGERVEVPNMGAPGQLDPFMGLSLRGFAASTGMSYVNASKDSSKATYSSSRQELVTERSMWRSVQNWYKRDFHQRVYAKWLDMAVLSGVLKLPNYHERETEYKEATKWIPRGWSWVDPEKEAKAYALAVRGGFNTLTEVLAENGKDIEETFKQRRRELDLAKKYGLVHDTDPSIPRYTGTENESPKKVAQDAE